ncbi:MAG: class I SAM-dependent methyltransferase [Weeksellaceae bacterium]|nr:class I SAM-dependent methyltransferase [Weeksellaceae bacterium]
MRKKLSKLYSFIGAVAREPSLINLITNRRESWREQFHTEQGHSNPLEQISLRDFAETQTFEIPYFTFLGGGSLPTDISLLRSACKKFPACKYFEIGTWRGESAINVADLTAVCHTLNLSANEMQQRGFSQEYIDAQAYLSKSHPKIEHFYGDSAQFDFAALNTKYDVIFIDGSHHYKDVLSDTRKVLKHLAHKDSIIIWHDYAYSPEEVRYEVYKAIIDALGVENQKHVYHVANTLCAILSNKNYPTSTLQAPVLPTHAYEVKFTAKSL